MVNQGKPSLKKTEKNEREFFFMKQAEIMDDIDSICSSPWNILPVLNSC